MFKVTITWAGSESEEYTYENREEAERFIKDVVPPYGNIRASIREVSYQEAK